jgi:hypothetical protein
MDVDGRRDLADPVGDNREELLATRCGRKALDAPGREVGDEHVAAEVELGFVDEDPSSWPVHTQAEGPVEGGGEAGGDDEVRPRRPCLRVEHAIDQLAGDVLWERFDVGIRRSAEGGAHR